MWDGKWLHSCQGQSKGFRNISPPLDHPVSFIHSWKLLDCSNTKYSNIGLFSTLIIDISSFSVTDFRWLYSVVQFSVWFGLILVLVIDFWLSGVEYISSNTGSSISVISNNYSNDLLPLLLLPTVGPGGYILSQTLFVANSNPGKSCSSSLSWWNFVLQLVLKSWVDRTKWN